MSGVSKKQMNPYMGFLLVQFECENLTELSAKTKIARATIDAWAFDKYVPSSISGFRLAGLIGITIEELRQNFQSWRRTA